MVVADMFTLNERLDHLKNYLILRIDGIYHWTFEDYLFSQSCILPSGKCILDQIQSKGTIEYNNDITVEDIRKWKEELEAKGIQERFRGDLNVTEYDEDHYKLSGCVWGIVEKKMLE